MADLGRAALVVSFGLALYALVGGTAAAVTRQRRLADSARLALLACFGSTVIASAVLIRALVQHDFTYAYVQAHTSRDLSTSTRSPRSGAGRRVRCSSGCSC